MRLTTCRTLKTGNVLAQTLYNERGEVLAKRGVRLTERMIARLVQLKIPYVYVEDGRTKDIEVEQVITDKHRIDAINEIKSTFTDIREGGVENRSYLMDKASDNLSQLVYDILHNIRRSDDSLSMIASVFSLDDGLFQHSLNVAIYSLAIGTKLGLSDKELSELGLGAIFHDVGKTFIDQDILNKKGKLTDEEFAVIKTHTELGFNYLRKKSNLPLVVAHCAYQHHERIDGTGYPRGISGKKMHKYAKIISIADVFDALTRHRVYRPAMLPHEGLEIIYAGALNLFDVEMVEAFKNSVSVYPNGLEVELSDGHQGIVIGQNTNLADRPIVRVFEDGVSDLQFEDIDLAKKTNVVITSCDGKYLATTS